jgi:hypothetical protein
MTFAQRLAESDYEEMPTEELVAFLATRIDTYSAIMTGLEITQYVKSILKKAEVTEKDLLALRNEYEHDPMQEEIAHDCSMVFMVL